MKGLTVRWSLEGASDEVIEEPRDHGADRFHSRVAGRS